MDVLFFILVLVLIVCLGSAGSGGGGGRTGGKVYWADGIDRPNPITQYPLTSCHLPPPAPTKQPVKPKHWN